MKIRSQKRYLGDFTVVLLLFSIAIFSGCSGKKQVIYVPKKVKTQADFHIRQEDPVKTQLTKQYSDWKGTRYKIGGVSRRGIDCSGFVQITYQQLFDKRLPRTVMQQSKMGLAISRNTLRPGDLVFFKTGIRQKHVGIYLENDSFMHVSQSKGLMVSGLSDVYWNDRFWKAKRLLQMDQVAFHTPQKP